VKIAVLVLIAVITLASFPGSAWAAGELVISTDYPGVTAKAGDSLSFQIDLLNNGPLPLNAALSEVSLPEGWSGLFSWEGREVSVVHVPARADRRISSVEYTLEIDARAPAGDYVILLAADAGDGILDMMSLTIHLSETETGSDSFTVLFSELEGAANTSFSFNATLVNNYSTAQSYSLATQAPQGWIVSYTPTSMRSSVANIALEPRTSMGITIAVSPMLFNAAGNYDIVVSAISPRESLLLNLRVRITESYGVELTTPSGKMSADAYVGRETPVAFLVNNTGNAELSNLNLITSLPNDWSARYEPFNAIELIEGGQSREFTIHITPSSRALSGDYIAYVTASNAYIATTAQLRVTVKMRTTWGILAVAIILSALALLFWAFKKFGRR
jgi:uncharacterized membrane protein